VEDKFLVVISSLQLTCLLPVSSALIEAPNFNDISVVEAAGSEVIVAKSALNTSGDDA
jgi:hypothetical protein